MKKVFVNLMLLGAVSFGAVNMQAQKTVVNREVKSEDGSNAILLGPQTISQFHKEPYKTWFDEEHDSYVIDQNAVEGLKKAGLNGYQLVVFVGTWCPDSHREFPRLMRILETVKYPNNKLEIIAVSRKKESPNGEEVMYHVERVPTIIVKKYGNEVGRIVEHPETGFLEKDLLNIIDKNGKAQAAAEKTKTTKKSKRAKA